MFTVATTNTIKCSAQILMYVHRLPHKQYHINYEEVQTLPPHFAFRKDVTYRTRTAAQAIRKDVTYSTRTAAQTIRKDVTYSTRTAAQAIRKPAACASRRRWTNIQNLTTGDRVRPSKRKAVLSERDRTTLVY